jgi:predicted component of type VI protein secretion system
MFNFGVGGQEVPMDASEGIADIPLNRTFLVQKLTNDEALRPESVYNLKNVEEVFQHFKPQVSVEMEKADGSTLSEDFRFSNLGDFSAKSFVERSDYLKDLSIQQEQFAKILKQLKTNKLLKNVLENPDSRAAFMDALSTLMQELEEN